MNRQSKKAERLKNMIATADVMPFMCNDVFSLGLVQCTRKINHRAEDTHHKRRVNIIYSSAGGDLLKEMQLANDAMKDIELYDGFARLPFDHYEEL